MSRPIRPIWVGFEPSSALETSNENTYAGHRPPHVMHQKQLELLKLLRDATRSGRIVWQRDDIDSHRTEVAGLHCSIRFKHPLLAGDEGSDADAVQITADGTVLTFYTGTEP